ncbi:MAG: Asp-tRNA(Asn)/Glu-tRNA(Gln) amidotransferase subunit GatA [Flavobacteriales bacterium]|nr:Asp-tRNA(Asn)/Glu-tRNA(Gln) amidotransferase subunit GatA [Flavobacteriales bacterium]
MPRTFHEAKAALASGEFTVKAMTAAALAQARAKADLNIFLETFDDSALAKAAEVDAKIAAGTAGPLAGAIISIKDNLCYAGHGVSASSRMLKGYVSPYSATVVERILAADAVIIGRTNCDEFAMGSSNETSAYGQVGNPLDPARVPGGSSGGAAASVAAGTCHIALASDTGGSIRQPASFCGVAGFKPTYGRVSRYGLIAFASSFDQVGPLAYDVEDLQAVQAVIAGPDDRDNTTSHRPFATADVPAKLRIGYYAQCLDVPGMDPEVRDRTLAEIDRLRAEGHSVVPVELAHADLFVPTYYILSTAEASSNLARFDGIRYGHRAKEAQGVEDTYRRSRSEGFGPEVQRRILLGTFVLSAGYYDAYYGQGMKVRRIIRDNTLETLAGLDLLLTPTCPSTAFLKGQISDPVTMYLQDIFTVQANLAGIPALSIPAGQHSNGMPFGIQLMAKPFEDERLLAAARRLFPC